MNKAKARVGILLFLMMSSNHDLRISNNTELVQEGIFISYSVEFISNGQ
jgi:hypothetical protein